MKKILIVNNNMHIGGVQKALVNLLWSIRGQYDITLLLFCKCGEYLTELPPEVKVLETGSGYRFFGMSQQETHSIKDKVGRIFYAGITRVLGRKHAIALMSLGQKQLEGFDVAISYLHNAGNKAFYGGCNDFVLKHVRAEKKITFLHCDYRLCGADTPENAEQYAQFDVIAACSQGCADSFLKANPELGEKVHVVYNCHRFEEILEAAQLAPVKMDPEKINLVTVARMGKEKGVERAIRVIAGLGPLKQKIHYYVVGDGVCRPLVLQIMKDNCLEDTVTLCGTLSNPYGYIQAADLMLIPSYSEAAPLVIGEAAALGTPILSMETSSAVEMIRQTGFGWVCENSEEAMGTELEALLKDPHQLQSRKAYLTQCVHTNADALKRFDEIMQ